MRIDGLINSNPVAVRRAGRKKKAGGQAFRPEPAGAASAAGAASPAGAGTPAIAPVQTSGIEAMLALQGVDNNLEERRRTVRHAHSMLDTLEEIKADLLLGNVGEGRLNKLMAQVSRARGQADPKLTSLVEEIDLLARVELAKLGRFV